jgi:glycosyltransferase involved in cell wall biosynthesis
MANLVLLTNSYPLFEGEYFLDDEINIIAHRFEKIHILCFHEPYTKKHSRALPQNVSVKNISLEKKTVSTLYKIVNLLNPILIKEVLVNASSFKNTSTFNKLKIGLGFFSKSKAILHEIECFLSENRVNVKEATFYSYWHDDKAMAISLLKKKYPDVMAIARAHGWDLDYQRHTPPYLPFKHFMLDHLNRTVCISYEGQRVFNSLFKNEFSSKITVSRLGKTNNRTPVFKKENKFFLICSCSNLIPLKRVSLIIDLISALKNKHIKWVHFGYGILETELKEYAKAKFIDIEFEFKGKAQNEEILDFYNQNFVDLFINLSETEGIPVSIMEAQSAGIPVLATDVGGTKEIVGLQNGFLVPKDFDMKETAATITQYLSSSDEEINNKRKNAYQNWQTNYNAAINYTKFADLLLK